MNVQRFQNGQIAQINTPAQPLTGQVMGNGENPIAGALAGVGQQVADISIRVAKANDAKNLLEANNAMQDELVSFSQWQQQNPEEKDWVPEWQRRMKGLGERYSKAPLTNDGRLRLSGMLSEWGNRQTMQVQGQAIRQTGQRAMDAANLTMLQAEKSRDYATGAAAIDTLVSGGVITPERAGLEKEQFSQKVQAGQREDALKYADDFASRGLFDDAIAEIQDAPLSDADKTHHIGVLNRQRVVYGLETMANDDPRQAIQKAYELERTNQIMGPQRIKVVEAAERRMDNLRADGMKAYAEEITLGSPDPGALVNKINADTYLKDADRRALFQAIAAGPVNDPGAYADLWTAAKTFTGEEGSPEYSRLITRIDMALNGEQKTSVMSQLGATVKGPKDGQTRAFNEVYSLVEQDRKNGVFGNAFGKLDDPKTVLSPEIRAQVDVFKKSVDAKKGFFSGGGDKTAEEIEIEARKLWHEDGQKSKSPWSKDKFEVQTIKDLNTDRQTTTRMMGVIANLDRWRAENPKATPEQFRAFYESLVPAQRAASGYVSPLLPAKEVNRVDLNDLLNRNATNP